MYTQGFQISNETGNIVYEFSGIHNISPERVKGFFERAECIGAFMSPEMENKPLFVELREKEVTKMFYGCLRWLWSESMGPWRRTGITHDGRDIVKRIRYS